MRSSGESAEVDRARPLDLVEPRNVMALRELARDIVRRGPGARLATSAEYQQAMRVGSGTVQKALKDLVRFGVVRVSTRGHQGTYVTDMDCGLLWAVAGLESVRLVLTPPGSLDGYGLVRGLMDEFSRIGVPIELSYARGSTSRLDWVLDGRASAAAVSAGAASALASRAEAELQVVDLGQDTYYSEDSVGVLAREGFDLAAAPSSVRVGIDPRSPDHVALTRAEFPQDDGYQYVDCDFVRMPAAVLDGTVDVGVWHRLVLVIPLSSVGIVYHPLSRASAQRVRRELSSAVLVFREDAREVGAILRQIDVDVIAVAQRRLRRLEPDSTSLEAMIWAR